MVVQSEKPKRRRRSDKLTGTDYSDFWNKRAEKREFGYVGRQGMTTTQLTKQADRFWEKLLPLLPPVDASIRRVVEFGCGWGRITNRLKQHYPDAEVWGIDMVLKSIQNGKELYPDVNFFCGSTYDQLLSASDLLVTCTCLQHITDTKVFQRVADSFRQKVYPGGHLVMLENACVDKRHFHLHEMRPEDYKEALHGFTFEEPIIVTDIDPEQHFLMRGRRDETAEV